jgi:hypothetical protein
VNGVTCFCGIIYVPVKVPVKLIVSGNAAATVKTSRLGSRQAAAPAIRSGFHQPANSGSIRWAVTLCFCLSE